jgi:succinate dehydrogenase/fumarate reductase flavoprotein subunit
MNEYPPAVQDTGARPLAYFDADRQEYPRIPCYLIFDESGRKLGPLADAIINTEEYRYQWSENNSVEIDRGWIKKANSIPELAKIFAMEPSVLTATVDRWNKFFRQRKDEEYGRQPSTMMAIEEPSFYAVESWPIVTNTQGGPVHDARQQIVNSYGEPVPRLYVAGELGSLFGYLYLEAGNNAECLIGGRIAGRNAAGEAPWTTE